MLGKLNFGSLARYLIKAADLNTWQTYIEDNLKELIIGNRSYGVIYGCEVSVVSGLTVQISAGLVLFSNNVLVAVAAQQITLDAADVSNPRLDRIELAYTLENGTSVTNIDGNSVVLDKIHTATIQKNAGTPAGSPSAPGLTAGRLSLAVVTVGTGVTNLNSGNISSTEDTYRSLSYFRFGPAGTQKFGFRNGRMEVTEDGSNWYPVTRRRYDDKSISLVNNQSALAISGMSFDAASFIAVSADVFISIKTDSVETVESGQLLLVYKPTTAAWDVVFNSNFDDAGLTFSIDTTLGVGQLKYATTNVAGANYVGKLRLSNIVTHAV